MNEPVKNDFTLAPDDGERLSNLVGPFDEHLRQIEMRLGVEIANRGNVFRVLGDERPVQLASRVLHRLYAMTESEVLTAAQINLHLQESGIEAIAEEMAEGVQEVSIKVKRGTIKGRGPNQARYLHAIATHDINFGIGPAGTGKTYLAVAMAVDALNDNRAQRLILVRPAVEAGEKLGFLPGDYQAKVNPYLRPIFDALGAMLPMQQIQRYIERDVIEVAPLAYMRGRTLDRAFILLDEAQNTTPKQMLMFLTRLGRRSKAVVTGDVSQTDLPEGQRSGLVDVVERLDGVDGVKVCRLGNKDIVRHDMVQRIIDAYEATDPKRE